MHPHGDSSQDQHAVPCAVQWPDPAVVLAALAVTPARLGETTLICIDGLAGSGKTTLARAVAEATGGELLHTDDLLEGWTGLPGLGATLGRVLAPLRSGQASSWRRWDWYGDTWAETSPLPLCDVLVVEGVGSSVGPHRDWISLLVWVDADKHTRWQRGLARDGVEMADDWRRWQADEAALHEMAGTAGRADLRFQT